jgi:hypothetical protein
MGATMPAGAATLTARLVGAQGQTLTWIRRGGEMAHETITAAESVTRINVAASPGDWFSVILQTADGDATLFSNALYTSR